MAKLNQETTPFPTFISGIISLLQILNHSWDTEDISGGETMWLADVPREGCRAIDLKHFLYLEEIMCLPSLHVLSSKYSFGMCSIAYPTIVHVSLALFEGLLFQRKMWFISNSRYLLLFGYERLFTLTVCALFPSLCKNFMCITFLLLTRFLLEAPLQPSQAQDSGGDSGKHGCYSSETLWPTHAYWVTWARQCLLGASDLEFSESLEELTVLV